MLNKILQESKIQFQAVRHLAVGGGGVLINWLVFSGLCQLGGLSILASFTIAYFVLFLYIFPLQRYFTFKEKRSKPSEQILKFLINSIGYIMLDFLFTRFFIENLSMSPVLGKGISLAVLTPLSFLSQKLWVFKKPL